MDGNVLDNSATDRRNILNNKYAVSEIQKNLDVKGVHFEGDYWLTTRQVETYFEIDRRTLRRYTEGKFKDELTESGYRILSGDELKSFRDVEDIYVLNIMDEKAPKQGIFNIRAFLNLAMLLSESQKAKDLRQMMLGIVTETVTRMAGGSTKYINQRDEKYLMTAFYNENYNKKFNKALKKYVTNGQDHAKYPNYNDRVYQTIFKENSREYKNILELSKQEKPRDTMYTEVLSAIASFENAVAVELKEESEKRGRTLTREEANGVFEKTAKHPAFEPQIELARSNMASLDHALRQKNHESLSDYISPISIEAYERFLGEKSKALSERIDENKEMFKRLRDK